MFHLSTSLFARKPIRASAGAGPGNSEAKPKDHLLFRLARATKNRGAFSLVEVTMAMGIISFGLVAVLGLMPVGLTTMRRAMDASIEEQIVQKITGEVLLTPFSRLSTSMVNKSFYFDDQGIAVEQTSDKARFSATVMDAKTAYPGSSAVDLDTPVTASVRMLQVKLVAAPNLNAASISTNYYRILVSNTGT